ncbi:MAG: BTAD domain-containing putative transcriptional regulator [Gemmatimonadales bacterium]
MSSRTRLEVLGTVRVSGRDPTAGTTVPTHERALGLLTYLALAEPPGFHRRDKLLAVFWPELDTTRARHALRQTVHLLRRWLGPVIARRGDRELGIDWAAFECDGGEFRDACRAGESDRAVRLYGGDLLDGFGIANAPEFERWLEDARAELRRQAVGAGLAAARGHAARGEAGETKRLASWVARLAPLDEEVARSAMGLLESAGDRAGAIDVYRRLEASLEAELEVEPSPETRALVDELRRSDPPPPRAEPRTERLPSSDAPSPSVGPDRRRSTTAIGALALAGGLIAILAFAPRLSGRGGASASVPPPGRVLWVDDNPENNEAVIGVLRARGVAVTTVRTTAEALVQLEADSFHAVITDIGRYEGGDYVPEAGMDLLRRVRALRPRLPAMVCTSARSADAHRAEAVSIGAREVFDDCAAVVAAVAGILVEPAAERD